MNLAAAAQTRDNNFQLLRIVAASLVLVTHSYTLSSGNPATEPLRGTLGITLGTIAVDVFFIASGFLVYGSLLRSRSLIEFGWARGLRIFPALLVMLAITVPTFGAAFGTLPFSEFLVAPETRLYVVKCSTLFAGVAYTLPGVFEHNPFPRGVNGSLWTLPYEVRMYAGLALLWLVSAFVKPRRDVVLQSLVLACAVGSAAWFTTRHLQGDDDAVFQRLAFMFFTGAACHVVRARIELSTPAFAVVATAIVASAFAGREIFFFTYALGIAYAVFYVAYVPAGVLRAYRHMGDYSYGMYIWAFPVQQAVMARWPGIRMPALMLSSGLVTLGLAILSWHLLESRALALRQRAAHWTLGLVSAGRAQRS